MPRLRPPKRGRRLQGRCIGILGGSFNPAHEGHFHISQEALKKLHVDEVWWMVSPQNPLKGSDDMWPFAERFASAKSMARHPLIKVTDVEQRLGTQFTVDTLYRLQKRYPRDRFIWLMGADNLAQIPKWKGWRWIFENVPVAVFARPSYSLRALSGKAARRYRRHRLSEHQAARLGRDDPPCWVFLHIRLHPASATHIRQMMNASRTA